MSTSVGESIWEPMKLTVITSAWCMKWKTRDYLCVMHSFQMFELDLNISEEAVDGRNPESVDMVNYW